MISFIFADLITLPLLLIYRRYYGTRLTLRLLAVFWVVMSVAGLAVEYLFTGLGLVPATHAAVVAPDGVCWNDTTILNILALIAFAALYGLYRNREHFDGGADYAKDPICGMQIDKATAPITIIHHGQTYYFCSEGCGQRFLADPDRCITAGSRDAAD
ncbi:MAG: YHS domain-containing protein [Pseudonocardiales bacterium]|nr:YHS domain-containing protein [Pseudonocardiales bacterium]MBV9729934.1 YHS domain-containing protein [Pseudonocardiales bacterium]